MVSGRDIGCDWWCRALLVGMRELEPDRPWVVKHCGDERFASCRKARLVALVGQWLGLRAGTCSPHWLGNHGESGRTILCFRL